MTQYENIKKTEDLKWEPIETKTYRQLTSDLITKRTSDFNKLDDVLNHYRKDIVGLPDNWDDHGAKGYTEETWERVAHLVRNILTELWNNMKDIYIPSILPVLDGSFDIHWNSEEFELLINIPMNEKCLVHLYGESKTKPDEKLDLRSNYKLINLVVSNWLKIIL